MNKSVAIIGTRGYPSYYGGFETAVRKLAPYLAERGWDVTVYGRKGSTRDDDSSRDARVNTVVTLGIESKSVSTLSYGLAATLHAALRRPNVVLVMNVANGFWLPLLNLRGVPSLVNVDGIEWDRAKWGRLAKRVFHSGARWTARHGTNMVFDAKEIGSRWRTEFGVDGEFIPYGGDLVGDTTIEPGLVHRQYVLIVARFVPENTILEFLDAVPALSERWDVVIVGSSGYAGPIDERVRELAATSQRVRWFGHVNDDDRLMSLWQHAGAYFHGHSVGGTNPALVQAMAAGAPTVARDTVYNREVLSHDGALFTSPESADILEKVSALMVDSVLQERLSSGAMLRAAAEYQWDAVCESYHQALLAIAN